MEGSSLNQLEGGGINTAFTEIHFFREKIVTETFQYLHIVKAEIKELLIVYQSIPCSTSKHQSIAQK